MSYLMEFTDLRAYTIRGKPVECGTRVFRVRWRSDQGNITVNPAGGVIIYPRHTKMGRRLSASNESEMFYIQREVRKKGGIWDREYVWMSEA